MITTLTEAFDNVEEILMKNIASHIFEYEFHARANEETLVAYYGGAYTNRDGLLMDTLRRLHSDQMKLRFLKEQRSNLNNTYGNEDPAGDISGTLQRSTGISPEPQGFATDAAEDGSSKETDSDLRQSDDADEGGDSAK